jgi:hypothetical protein
MIWSCSFLVMSIWSSKCLLYMSTYIFTQTWKNFCYDFIKQVSYAFSCILMLSFTPWYLSFVFWSCPRISACYNHRYSFFLFVIGCMQYLGLVLHLCYFFFCLILSSDNTICFGFDLLRFLLLIFLVFS